MEKMNQDYIVEALKNQGVNPEEIETRLMKWKMSTSGHYDPIANTYTDQTNDESTETLNVPQKMGIPLPSWPVENDAKESSNVPHLRNQEEIDKEFLEPFELDPTIEDEPILYCFDVGGVPCIPKGDQQANKGQQKNGKTFTEVLFMGAALKGEFLGVKCLIPNAKVLFVDTEQHPRNTRLVYRRVCQIAGINGRERHERLNMLHLRLSDDVETTKKAIRLKIKYFRPDIVFVDGIVD